MGGVDARLLDSLHHMVKLTTLPLFLGVHLLLYGAGMMESEHHVHNSFVLLQQYHYIVIVLLLLAYLLEVFRSTSCLS